ncbi:exosome non-catalytic core subunit rrp46 [Tieghemiomyces parasiticus]|uniref:Exosome non-catalytic core subunit rrp46 n=1 Tax=Tieghemiomyces parasiticus TaxID=78921 RepID=A0A9W8AB15_9FUNG|nr:exosome non-catalytic core subunit rrp46 [Tieghemiomyces parasiticus]
MSTCKFKRADGRSDKQIRPYEMTQALLNRADGSARFTQTPSSVLCAVYGPMEVRIRDEKVDQATIEVHYKPLASVSSIRDRWVEHSIRRVFEGVILTNLNPSTLIRIELQEMSAHGSTLSAAFNAATVALMDAGVPMQTLVASVTCAIDEQDRMLLDPTAEETKSASSVHIFAFDTNARDILFSDSIGTFDQAQYEQCYKLCQAAAEKTIEFIRKATTKRLLTQAQQIKSGKA